MPGNFRLGWQHRLLDELYKVLNKMVYAITPFGGSDSRCSVEVRQLDV